MPQEKGDYWDNYEEVIVDGKVRFKCMLGCGDSWAKNETRLKEHSENCSKQQRASNNNQTTLDNYVKVVPRQSQKVYEILLTRAFISSGIPFNVIENPDFLAFLQKTNPSYTVPSRYRIFNILATLRHLQQEKYGHEIGHSLLKTKIALRSTLTEESIVITKKIQTVIWQESFWLNLKHLRDFLKLFANFIHMIEGNYLLLSTAYVEFIKLQNIVKNNQQIPKEISSQAVKFGNNRCDKFFYNPAIMVAYKLDPHYQAELLDPLEWDELIEKEIIRLAGNKSSELVLKELANYIGKIGPFSSTHLWDKLKEDPIELWNLVSNHAPNLSEVALKVFSIPASSALNINIKETTNTTEIINVEEEETIDETYDDINLFYDSELDEANKLWEDLENSNEDTELDEANNSLNKLWEDSENSNKDMDYL
ncbi:27424_t:CDS:2, partial [Dentiscutata erythropus]